jgi:hypothetical protein
LSQLIGLIVDMVSRETALDEAVSKLLENPSHRHIIHRYHQGLNANFFDKKWVEIVFQKLHQQNITMSDAAVFASIWTEIHLGNLLTLQIPIGRRPSSDDQLQTNSDALETLPLPFSCELWGRNFEQDGLLEWNVSIQAGSSKAGEALLPMEISNGKSPLEIGSTESSTTFSHLKQNRCLARWPYCHNFVTLLYLLPQSKFDLVLPSRISNDGRIALQ